MFVFVCACVCVCVCWCLFLYCCSTFPPFLQRALNVRKLSTSCVSTETTLSISAQHSATPHASLSQSGSQAVDMPFVLYNVQGEEGDDPQHPNYFRASFPASPVLSDFVAQFPLALLGTFHYRFKKKTDNDYGYVWKDVSSLNERIPLFNGMVWAKVLQTSTEPTDLARAAAAAAADAAAAATAQKKPKRPPALRMKQSTRVSNDKRKPSSQSPRPDKPKVRFFLAWFPIECAYELHMSFVFTLWCLTSVSWNLLTFNANAMVPVGCR